MRVLVFVSVFELDLVFALEVLARLVAKDQMNLRHVVAVGMHMQCYDGSSVRKQHLHGAHIGNKKKTKS